MAKINDNGILRDTICSEELRAIHDALDILGGKWKLRLLRYLTNRAHQVINFKKMVREIEGISAKMLSKELKELEANLLITRTEVQTKPLSVIYTITEYGKTVVPVTDTLVQWGLNHREKIICEMTANRDA
ncbi:winged helix-turn-helix transcriptional regulator [Flavobacterium psychrotrophum]|uniref:winged helix-turn-helix transcriptional regulator n=1 Tax=Flavobacterium psychrotrophum TaxID=2294119 RepID=UPI000E319A08|nr:helix-turn-helix domain-containing protein [Flavobacterium psychrotrophum]